MRMVVAVDNLTKSLNGNAHDECHFGLHLPVKSLEELENLEKDLQNHSEKLVKSSLLVPYFLLIFTPISRLAGWEVIQHMSQKNLCMIDEVATLFSMRGQRAGKKPFEKTALHKCILCKWKYLLWMLFILKSHLL